LLYLSFNIVFLKIGDLNYETLQSHKKALTQSILRLVKLIIIAHVVIVKNNLFAMGRIQVHLFHLLHIKLKKLKQLIFVDVNNRLLSRFAMEHTQNFKSYKKVKGNYNLQS
tara:strand:+ start:754 stop:1086 length:333 start_codon:yes stop_codon:yes gene_type:complete